MAISGFYEGRMMLLHRGGQMADAATALIYRLADNLPSRTETAQGIRIHMHARTRD